MSLWKVTSSVCAAATPGSSTTRAAAVAASANVAFII